MFREENVYDQFNWLANIKHYAILIFHYTYSVYSMS
jgi:hypothetical protein